MVGQPILGLLVFLAVLMVPVYLSGEGAEEIVEHRPGISEAVIETHEKSALVSLIAVQVVGLIALVGLVAYRRRPAIPRAFTALILAFAVAAGASLAHTANSGGLIRHPEISGPPAIPHEAHRER